MILGAVLLLIGGSDPVQPCRPERFEDISDIEACIRQTAVNLIWVSSRTCRIHDRVKRADRLDGRWDRIVSDYLGFTGEKNLELEIRLVDPGRCNQPDSFTRWAGIVDRDLIRMRRWLDDKGKH
ncbi:MAG: hypothetical protein ACAH11_11035 [Sphingomonas sp.]